MSGKINLMNLVFQILKILAIKQNYYRCCIYVEHMSIFSISAQWKKFLFKNKIKNHFYLNSVHVIINGKIL